MLPIGPPDFVLELMLGEVAKAVTTGQKVLPARALELGYTFKHPDLAEALKSALAKFKPEPAVVHSH
jgi:NAD dependent epimerase/dehydratase family enzyme